MFQVNKENVEVWIGIQIVSFWFGIAFLAGALSNPQVIPICNVVIGIALLAMSTFIALKKILPWGKLLPK